jgi:fructose-1-phosphate kinase PfkB-like protein
VNGPSTVTTLTLNPTIDVGLVVDELMADHKMLASSVRREPGGGGVNVARSLNRLGTSCTAVIAKAGATGVELIDLLTAEGLSTRTLPSPGQTRESFSLTDASDGSQYRVVTPGPAIASADALISAAIDAATAAQVVLTRGEVGAIVVSLGPEGALLVERDHQPCRYEAPPIEGVVSTVGCGDAMVAGIVRALELGRPLGVAVGFGVAAGTAAATSPGTELFDPAVARALEMRMVVPVSV